MNEAAIDDYSVADMPGRDREREIDVLVIDDDKHALVEIGEYLSSLGYRVMTADDGHAGFAAAVEHRPRVIVCDIVMPEWDGMRVAEALSLSGSRSTFIVVSGHFDALDQIKGRNLSVSAVLEKPLWLPELRKYIDAAF